MSGQDGVHGVLLLDGHDALALIRTAIREARKRIWVTQFIIDARPSADRRRTVRYLLHALVDAAARGIDVRVLLGVVMAPAGPSYDISVPAAAFLAARGVRVRQYAGDVQRRHLHAKTVIIDDDLLLTGNLNWTARAFEHNTEQSVAIRAIDVTSQAARRFEQLWRLRSRRYSADLVTPTGGHRGPRASGRLPRPYRAADPHRPNDRRGIDRYGELFGQIRAGCSVQLLAGQPYVRQVEALVTRARLRVFVAMAGMRASTDARLRRLLLALRDAHQRGVDVRVLFQHRDGPERDLVADVRALRRSGVPLRSWPLDTYMHLRCVIVDEAHAILGSTGWTPQSVYLTEESSVCIEDVRTAKLLIDQFEHWWCSGSADRGKGQTVSRCPCSDCMGEASLCLNSTQARCP